MVGNMKKECDWREEDGDVWETECGEAFCFIDSGPEENGMRFCCYCGKPLKAIRAEPEG